MLLAEQIVIDCPPQRLGDFFRHRPVDWITPLLRLAGDEGEAAGLAVLGESAEGPDRTQGPGGRQHRAEVGEVTGVDGGFRAVLHWCTTDYRALFREFDGTVDVRPLQGHSVLSIEGLVTGPPGAPASGPATVAVRRAAEYAVRSLLGHLRTAVEASPFAAR